MTKKGNKQNNYRSGGDDTVRMVTAIHESRNTNTTVAKAAQINEVPERSLYRHKNKYFARADKTAPQYSAAEFVDLHSDDSMSDLQIDAAGFDLHPDDVVSGLEVVASCLCLLFM